MTYEPPAPLLESSQPELIVSAALYLMSSFACSGGCPKLAHVILRHLNILTERTDLPAVMRQTCAQLAEQWEQKLATLLPRASEPQPMAAVLPFKHPLMH